MTSNGVETVERDNEDVIIYKDSGNEYKYPESYGTTCAAHDEPLEPYCSDAFGSLTDAPSWCEAKWCYVDAATCERDDVEATTFFEGYELYYSYSNCDASDTFTGSLGEDESGSGSGSSSGSSSSSGAMEQLAVTAAGLALSLLYLC